MDSIYTSYKPLILTVIQFLRREPTFDEISPFNWCTKRSLLPFLVDALSWFTGTATTKDVRSIKNRVNQVIAMQHQQQAPLVHIVSILNVTRYVTQANRWHINLVLEASRKGTSGHHHALQYHQFHSTPTWTTSRLYSTSPPFWQIWRDSLYYMRQVAMHALDYIDAATTGILSPHVLLVEDLQKMVTHIEEALPSTVHLTISSEDTLHFYWYLCTHVLITDEEFLLLIDIPI